MRNTEAKLNYVYNMTKESHKTDNYARPIEEDMVYMYIANYVDIDNPSVNIPYDHLGDGKDMPYPFYLTEYCRTSYDSYIKNAGGMDTIADAINGFVELKNFKDVLISAYQDVRNLESIFKTVFKVADSFHDLNDGVGVVSLTEKLINGDKTAAEVVTAIEDDIYSAGEVDKEAIVYEVVGFLVAASAGSAGLTTYMIYKSIDTTNAYASLFGAANWHL
ncbi:MAG: hypothetical protein ACK5LV_07815 [Lachnospirales bacterium]